ncbi:MAG: ABC transporter ATP-binding protein [Lentisphaerae bacterium]|nr:ABC transporter ATP-binding protein [Lentisphaerota bacterium]
MTAGESLYDVKDLHKDFRLAGGVVKVLCGLNFTVQRGQWTALVGPSGSGKTTLLHLLGGLDRPTSGAVMLEGVDLATLPARRLTALRRRRIGFVFQAYHLFPELSAWENAALPALHWGEARDDAFAKARQWLERFGLGARLEHRPQELSGGEQQRVAIARALINDPDVILADEPTGNLDAAAAADIMAILAELRATGNKTLVMVTHDQALAARADAVVTLKKQ